METRQVLSSRDRRTPSEHARRDAPSLQLAGKQIRKVFVQDWHSETGERLDESLEPPESGEVFARTIASGKEGPRRIRLMYLMALRVAKKKIRIVTPYFVPDQMIIQALESAVLRNVDVSILVPMKNIPVLREASRYVLARAIGIGCRVFLTLPPLDHSKIMTVDDEWSFLGSSNWDALSLTRNLELNLECYSDRLGRTIGCIIENKASSAEELSLASLSRRPMFEKLVDRLAAMMAPFL